MKFPVIQIGPLAVQTPGLILLAGLWISLAAAENYSQRFNLPSPTLYNLAFLAIVAGVVGARLAFIIQSPAPFLANPLNLLAFSSQMLNLEAGVLIGVLAALVYGQRKNLHL